MVMWNGVGGSTVHWEGHFPRLHPSDFRVHRLDGVADDWPIAYADLQPFYDLNDRNVGVSRASPAIRQTRGYCRARRLPCRSALPERRVYAASRSSAGTWWPSDNAILSRDHDGRLGPRQPRPLQFRLRAPGQGIG